MKNAYRLTNWRFSLRPHVASAACLWATLCFVGVCLADSATLFAQQTETLENSREYAIKAAYLYNFSRYVEWPETAFPDEKSPFVIGLLGRDPFGEIVDEIARTKAVAQRQIIIKRFNTLAEYSPCHILFISASVSPEEKARVINAAQKSSVLLVGEEPNLVQQGAVINFYVQDNTVRFEICPKVAEREGLKISSKLLRLAKIVE